MVFLIQAGCGTIENVKYFAEFSEDPADAQKLEYVRTIQTRFLNDAARYGVSPKFLPITVQFATDAEIAKAMRLNGSPASPNNVAVCFFAPRLILFSRDWWIRLDNGWVYNAELMHRENIYHEMAHCALNVYEHYDAAKDIMNTRAFEMHPDDWEYYVAKLFARER